MIEGAGKLELRYEWGKISIIVPVYNVSEHLSKCIQSLTNQSYRNIEILLIDDGSTDGSSKICDYWCRVDNRVRAFHTCNNGVSAARNLGIEKATGTYLAFVDADDWINSDMYEKLMCGIINGHAKISIGGYVIERENGVYRYLRQGENSRLTSDEARKEAYVSGRNQLFDWSLCDKLFEKSLWKNIRFDNNITMAEDMLVFWEILGEVNDVVYLPCWGYHYTMRLTSACNTTSDQHVIDDLYVKEYVFRDSEQKKMDVEIIQNTERIYRDAILVFLQMVLKGTLSVSVEELSEEEHHILYLRSIKLIDALREKYDKRTKIGIIISKLSIEYIYGIGKLYRQMRLRR